MTSSCSLTKVFFFDYDSVFLRFLKGCRGWALECQHHFPFYNMSDTFNWFSQKRKFPSRYAYLNTTFTFGTQTEDNFLNRKVRCRRTYSFIHSFWCPLFLWGESRGQQPQEDPKDLTINNMQLQIVLLFPHQDGTKQGRRCSHAIRAAFQGVYRL